MFGIATSHADTQEALARKERVRTIRIEGGRRVAAEAKAREERMKRKDEEQIGFFSSFKKRNLEMAVQVKRQSDLDMMRARGRLSSLIAGIWSNENALIPGIGLSRKDVLSLIYSMDESDGIYTRMLMVLGALEHTATFDNLKMQLSIAMDGYGDAGIVELPIERMDDGNE